MYSSPSDEASEAKIFGGRPDVRRLGTCGAARDDEGTPYSPPLAVAASEPRPGAESTEDEDTEGVLPALSWALAAKDTAVTARKGRMISVAEVSEGTL